ncbi:O-methyltransferase family 3 protein [Mycena sp. CBHHK59/15]|nr:O-methyltransferase family 3 protein [Mycena sp. CBHHK59/15]KAJ6626274.1 O-methyltransferase family 3 protein [Mycena sp. CBHHK59/15]
MAPNHAPTALISPELYDLWAHSDCYHCSFLLKPDPVLDAVMENTKAKGVESEQAVSPAQGKFMHLLMLSMGAKHVLEVGSLGGYSAIWMARALPDNGKVIALELEELHAKLIEENVANAGLSSKVKVIVGDALESMQRMDPDPAAPFDFVFIDADKKNNVNYFVQAKRLLRKGGVIMVDNFGRRGRLVDPDNHEPSIEGTRNLLRHIKDDPEVEAVTVHTVGEKGYDGFLFAVRK